MQATKEQLLEAANRLLNCFQNLDRWPKLSVTLSKKTRDTGPVGDKTRKALKTIFLEWGEY